ncbi:hypothetical protein NUW54_g1038 [Trametes sanguinea]|uniref:Uncharacterized protein n=1 Tax=Trametes sanguinea TaxID=158606 RepID=A0ACC1Q9V3_9APHY|nr:hypothetical protein NUW54_g1038 [Trametes sanguinea]
MAWRGRVHSGDASVTWRDAPSSSGRYLERLSGALRTLFRHYELPCIQSPLAVMSCDPDALLHACILAKNPASFKDSDDAPLIHELLHMATMCAHLATRYSAGESAADEGSLRADYKAIYNEDLIQHLVPHLHDPVHTSIIGSVIDSVAEPLNNALCPRIFASVKSRLLQELCEPLVERALPLLQENLLEYILGDDFKQFHGNSALLQANPRELSAAEPVGSLVSKSRTASVDASPSAAQICTASDYAESPPDVASPGPSKRPRRHTYLSSRTPTLMRPKWEVQRASRV